MRAIVLLNVAAGSIDDSRTREETRRVAAALHAADVEADLRVVEAGQLPDAAREAAGSDADVVVAGGGDGSLSAAAGVLAGGGKPFGVLPLGTLNHFARDLGIPLELEDAARTIATGHTREIDLGEVNGRIFLNNSSIGLYPRIVAERETERRRLGRDKWPAMLSAVLRVFRRFPLVTVHLRVEGRETLVRSPFVFVGNNRYEVSLFSVGGRDCLDAGELCLYLARVQSRGELLRLVLRALAGRLDQDRDFETTCFPELEVRTPRRSLRVALDGELVRMEPPLRYRIRPRALRVLAPPARSPRLPGGPGPAGGEVTARPFVDRADSIPRA